jgi:hypothetical protein
MMNAARRASCGMRAWHAYGRWETRKRVCKVVRDLYDAKVHRFDLRVYCPITHSHHAGDDGGVRVVHGARDDVAHRHPQGHEPVRGGRLSVCRWISRILRPAGALPWFDISTFCTTGLAAQLEF